MDMCLLAVGSIDDNTGMTYNDEGIRGSMTDDDADNAEGIGFGVTDDNADKEVGDDDVFDVAFDF